MGPGVESSWGWERTGCVDRVVTLLSVYTFCVDLTLEQAYFSPEKTNKHIYL